MFLLPVHPSFELSPDAKASLVSSEELYAAPLVKPLLPDHLDNAFESIEAAFKDDPFNLYLHPEKQSPARRSLFKRIWKLKIRRDIRNKLAYTVDDGDAVIIATPPENDKKSSSPFNRILGFLLDTIGVAFLSSSPEEAKRNKEVRTKMSDVTKGKLGERAKSMYYIDLVATRPEKQRHGYGTALIHTVLFSADIRARPVFLFSSSLDNVPYYESFGFVRAGEVVFGNDNPKWKKPPVVLPLMVREARGREKN